MTPTVQQTMVMGGVLPTHHVTAGIVRKKHTAGLPWTHVPPLGWLTSPCLESFHLLRYFGNQHMSVKSCPCMPCLFLVHRNVALHCKIFSQVFLESWELIPGQVWFLPLPCSLMGFNFWGCWAFHWCIHSTNSILTLWFLLTSLLTHVVLGWPGLRVEIHYWIVLSKSNRNHDPLK